jgi:uncharacterized membrane protein
VLFIMISNHYAMTYRHEHAWAVLAGIMAAGVFIRHFFNLRHKGRVEWKYPAAGVALLLAWPWRSRRSRRQRSRNGRRSPRRAVRAGAGHHRAALRGLPCGASDPARLRHRAGRRDAGRRRTGISQNAQRIYQQAVQLKAMPLANLTNMTDAERAQLAAWFEAGAKTETEPMSQP